MRTLESYLTETPPLERKKEVLAYLSTLDHLNEIAPEIGQSIVQELKDQRSFLKLIASENFSSLSVQLAAGNILTDKYAEGYPGHRFYAGCENVDRVENRAAELAKALFKCDHAYVQPHSGADANLVAFWAILTEKVQIPFLEKKEKKSLEKLTPEEFEELRQLLCNQTLLGMSLSSGGHLSHGLRQNVSAKMMRAVAYDVDPKTHLLDYAHIATIAEREKPLILLAGYSAYPRRINFAKMREIADQVGAVLMVDMAHFAGLVAGEEFKNEENPIPYAQIVTTTTHKTLRGPRGGMVLCQEAYIDSVNKGCPLILGGPLPHIIAAKAIAFQEASTAAYKEYARRVVSNARSLAEGLKKRGLTLVTGGTDNHLILIDLSNQKLSGKVAEECLREAGLTVNRNMIPFDPNGAWQTSGVRLGTPAVTTLGMGKNEMDEIADLIATVLLNRANGAVESKLVQRIKERVKDLLSRFPLYPEIQLN